MDAEAIEKSLKRLRWSRRVNLLIYVANLGLLLWVHHYTSESRRVLAQLRVQMHQLSTLCTDSSFVATKKPE